MSWKYDSSAIQHFGQVVAAAANKLSSLNATPVGLGRLKVIGSDEGAKDARAVVFWYDGDIGEEPIPADGPPAWPPSGTAWGHVTLTVGNDYDDLYTAAAIVLNTLHGQDSSIAYWARLIGGNAAGSDASIGIIYPQIGGYNPSCGDFGGFAGSVNCQT